MFASQLLVKHLLHYIKKKKGKGILQQNKDFFLNKPQLLFLLT